MLAIYKKELKSYFTSAIACLFIAITALIEGGFFFMYNLGYGTPYIIYPVSNALLIMVFTIPVLTMKSISDELHQKTDQLLMTSPVTLGKVVMGKYLSLATIYLIPILITCTYPLILSRFGAVPMRLSYTEIFGMLIYGLALIAIGMFISSITESQVIAAILSIVFMFIGYMMPNVSSTISSEENIITKILSAFDLITPAGEFLNGIFYVPGLVYYVTLIVVFLFLTTQSLQKRRWNVSRNTISTSVFSTSFIAIVMAVAVVVNLTVGNLADEISWFSVDMTDQKMYSLTDDTKKMLKDVKDDIVIYVLGNEESTDVTIDETLKRFNKENQNIKYEYKDTTKYPRFYTEYTDAAPASGSLIVADSTSNKSKVIDYSEIYTSGSYDSTYSGYDGEGRITSAINYVTSDDNPIVYQVTGHDEIGVGSTFTDAIEKMNIDIKEVNLLNYDDITTDECEMMLLLSPSVDYSKEEAEKIISYLDKGGKVLMTTNYTGSKFPNFYSVAEHYGIEITDGIVSENDNRFFYQNQFYVLSTDGSGFASGLGNYAFFGYPQGMKINQDNKNYKEDAEYVEMLATTDKAVCKMNPDTAQTFEKEDGDVEGPFSLAVSVSQAVGGEDADTTGTAKLAVFASATVFSDEYDAMVSGANLEMFKNVLNDYVESKADTVSIPVKETTYANLTINDSLSRFLGIVVAIIVPVVVLFVGIVVWYKRRRK